jgi:drug/metabolite transporter (DMT)-like permease
VKIPAILLIVVGIAIVIWGAFGFQTRDKVLDVGPIHATKETTHNVPYGPLAGAILALGGVVLLVKAKS